MKRTFSRPKSKVNPFNIVTPFNLDECVVDTPVFKTLVHDHESMINDAGKEIKTIRKNLKNVIKCHEELGCKMETLSSSLRDYQYVQFSSMSEDQFKINYSFVDYSVILAGVEKMREDLVSSLTIDLKSLEDCQKNKYDMLNEKKKRYEKELAKAEKLSDTFVKSSVQTDELVRNTQLQQTVLHVASTDYLKTINIVHSFNRLGFHELMFSVISKIKSFYEIMGETFRGHHDFLLQIQNSLNQAMDDNNFQNQKNLALMGESDKNPRKVTEDGTFSGYLYVGEKANKKKLQFASVKKYFCEYNKSTCVLNRCDVSENHKDQILVGRCRPCLSNKFAFDIYTESTSEFTTYVAITEDEFVNWCTILGISSAIDQSQNQEFPTEYTLSDHSVKFVDECIRLIEESEEGLNTIGIYRIEGSKERKLSLLELGADPKTFDRFRKLCSLTNDCLIDVTCVLKTYLKLIRPSLISETDFTLLRRFVENCDDDQKIDLFTLVLSDSSPLQTKLLRSMLEHLRRVSLKSEVNMMSLDNIAVCFANSFVYIEMNSLEQLSQMAPTFKVIKMCIQHCDKILADLSAERLDELQQRVGLFLSDRGFM